MSRSLSTKREMRLIRPLQVGFLQKLIEQPTVLFAHHDQRGRFIGHEIGSRELPHRWHERLIAEMQ